MSSAAAPVNSPDPVKRVKSSDSHVSHQSMGKVGKVTSNITKRGEFGYPNGHLGHLTAAEESALEEFKKIVTSEGLYTPGKDDKPPSHSDTVLLRFLRARRFVPKDALGQFKDTEQWRKLNELDNLYMNIDVDDYDESRKHYPQWLGRRDKRGMPVYLYRVGALDSKTMSAYTKSANDIRMAKPEGTTTDKKAKGSTSKEKTPPRLLRLFALYENLGGPMFKVCTALTDRPNPETPISQSNNIVDISNVGLKQFWNLRGFMQEASTLATSHYPETLDRIFIVGAPSFFPTVWGWIKRWFDPITVSKIFILSEAQAFPVLSQFIATENIPKQYGGTLDFQYGDLATIDPDYADRITWKDDGGSGVKNTKGELRRWPKGSYQWIEREDGNWDLLGVGSLGGKQRREVMATLRFDGELGGWADHSMPHSQKHLHQPAGNGVTNGTANGSAKRDADPAPVQTTADTATVTNDSKAQHDMSLPIRTTPATDTTSNSTLLPIHVPGAATSTSNGHVPVSADTTTTNDTSAKLPPEPAINSTEPVPLAAVAQPLPAGDENSKG